MKTVNLNLLPDNVSLMMRRKKENQSLPTPAEAHVIRLLDLLGEKYVFEKGLLTGDRFYIVDFYFPKPRKLCLEVDGKYHNDRRAYDERRDSFIRNKRKMNMVRITNERAMGLDLDDMIKLLDDNSKQGLRALA
jgi:very-short-patch-repair endonuclease